MKSYKRYLNLREMVADCAAKYGDKPYLKYLNGNNDIEELSFNSLADKVAAFSTFLLEKCDGVKRVAIFSENRYEWLLAYISVICSGNVVIPMDKELHFDQAKSFMELADADAVIFSGKFKTDFSEMAQVGKVNTLICFDKVSSEDKFLSFDECLLEGKRLIENGSKKYARLRTDSSKMCEILFTSGTTGTSKGVMLSEAGVLHCIYCASNTCGINSDDVALSVLPFNHTYEVTAGLLTPLCLGTTVCINNSLKYVMKNIKRFKPTVMVVVPLFVNKIYRKINDTIEKTKKEKLFSGAVKLSGTMRKTGIDVRRIIFSHIHKELGGKLKNIICGGAALDPQLVGKFENLGITLIQGYGITECSPLVSINPPEKIKANSVGLPIDGSVIRIVGQDEDGSDINLSVNETGEICVKGPQVMLGYFKNKQATEEAFNDEGFFRTGDYGHVDEDGYIYITGRKKNIIILENGKNVYPEELEEYLGRCDIVNECAVVLREINGEQLITAVVYPEYGRLSDSSEDEIKSRIKQEIININKTLPIFKQIRNIEIKKTEFEKTTTKKIIRSKI